MSLEDVHRPRGTKRVGVEMNIKGLNASSKTVNACVALLRQRPIS